MDIIMICVHAQMQTKTTKDITGKKCWSQVHYWYNISFVCSTNESKHISRQNVFICQLNECILFCKMTEWLK